MLWTMTIEFIKFEKHTSIKNNKRLPDRRDATAVEILYEIIMHKIHSHFTILLKNYFQNFLN